MEEYINTAVEIRQSYRAIHRGNLELVQRYYKKEREE
jgi:hypothetical protein